LFSLKTLADTIWTNKIKTLDISASPGTPTGGALLYAKDGRLYTKNTDGVESLMFFDTTISLTASGFTGTVTTTCNVSQRGNIIVLNLVPFTGTSNSNTMDLGALPVKFRPSSERWSGVIRCLDNTTAVSAAPSIATNGVIGFQIEKVSGAFVIQTNVGFTSSGTKGVPSYMTIVYRL
jgi:hypothetical protein